MSIQDQFHNIFSSELNPNYEFIYLFYYTFFKELDVVVILYDLKHI